MKKTDIAMIILIALASVMIAFFVTRGIMGEASEEVVKVNTIERINVDDFADPDPDIFNAEAINPAVEVNIDDTNQ